MRSTSTRAFPKTESSEPRLNPKTTPRRPPRFLVRQLTIDDVEQLKEVYLATSTWMGADVSKEFIEENFLVAKTEYLEKANPSRILLGAFDGKNLVMTLGIYFWNLFPSCTFLRMVGRRDVLSTSDLFASLHELYDEAFDQIEARNYNRFYLLSTARHFGVLARMGRTQKRLVSDYLMTVEEVIAPGTKPRFDFIWQMMGEQTWPSPLILRSGTLRNHKRVFDTKFLDDETARIFNSSEI